MAVFKTIFNLIILGSSSMIGILYGRTFNKRAKNMLDLEYCIRILETEILIGNNPLPEALENVYIKGKGDIANIFHIIKEDLVSKGREDIYYSFLELKDTLESKFSLKEEDIEVIMFLGKVLGKTNRIDQEKNFTFIKEQINQLTIHANLEKVRNEKLYRSLGVLVGIGIIIILI